jgi:hypothetical protein
LPWETRVLPSRQSSRLAASRSPVPKRTTPNRGMSPGRRPTFGASVRSGPVLPLGLRDLSQPSDRVRGKDRSAARRG